MNEDRPILSVTEL